MATDSTAREAHVPQTVMKSRAHEVLVPPVVTGDGLEISLHTVPRALRRELEHVFGGSEYGYMDDMLVIPTCQHARHDLVQMGDEIEAEKDRLLNVFMQSAKDITEVLHEKGYWADYIDPCSGLAVINGNANKVFSEVECMQCLLSYRTMNAGICKVLLHPVWGSSVYPASIFTTAPKHEARSVVLQFVQDRRTPTVLESA